MPDLRAVLMDEPTLLAYRPLWGEEPEQCRDLELDCLQEHERAVYLRLRSNSLGQKVRLEQERLPWDVAVRVLRDTLKYPG